jgi:transposase
MQVTTLGIDLAKNVFRVHGCDASGKVAVSKSLTRRQLQIFVATLPPCLVGMEACATAHYWAREIQKHGHEVRLMAPQYVRPYVKTNKNDTRDAEAICEAVRRPTMRFVAVKSPAQQDVQALHRVRQQLVKEMTALCNQVRGLLAEYGVVIPRGIAALRPALSNCRRAGQWAQRFNAGVGTRPERTVVQHSAARASLQPAHRAAAPPG